MQQTGQNRILGLVISGGYGTLDSITNLSGNCLGGSLLYREPDCPPSHPNRNQLTALPHISIWPLPQPSKRYCKTGKQKTAWTNTGERCTRNQRAWKALGKLWPKNWCKPTTTGCLPYRSIQLGWPTWCETFCEDGVKQAVGKTSPIVHRFPIQWQWIPLSLQIANDWRQTLITSPNKYCLFESSI